MLNIMLRRILLIGGIALVLMAPAHAQTLPPEIYGMSNKQAPLPQAPTGQIPSDSRFILSDDFKTCTANTDCIPFATTCDSGTPRCCEFEAINKFRENDVKAIKDKMCSTSAVHPIACTMCETTSSQKPVCKKNQCVYKIDNSPAQ
jgi:hypothetical protein